MLNIINNILKKYVIEDLSDLVVKTLVYFYEVLGSNLDECVH